MSGHNYRPSTDSERREEYEERAAIGEYERGMTRADAERAARLLVYGDEQLTLTGEPVRQPTRRAARSKRR